MPMPSSELHQSQTRAILSPVAEKFIKTEPMLVISRGMTLANGTINF